MVCLIVLLPLLDAVPNLCVENNGNCSHLCLLSSTAPEGYSCACPDGLTNSDEPNICRGEDHNLEYLILFYCMH